MQKRTRWAWWMHHLTQPSTWAVRIYRMAHRLWEFGLHWLALALTCIARILSGVEIHPQAKIGPRFVIAHGVGVVIGETAEIGADCLLLHGVTLGAKDYLEGRMHPKLGDRVRVGAGAVLLGPITVGDDAFIGANAVVLSDVPPGAIAVGVPARILRSAGSPGVSGASGDLAGGGDPPPMTL